MEVRLTPAGELRWELRDGGVGDTAPTRLEGIFRADWREGLFALAAEKIDPQGSSTLRYWRELAERYLLGLCHISGAPEDFSVEAPSPAELATLLLVAPPMRGGEYLCDETLLAVWRGLANFVHEAATSAGGLDALLKTRAAQWHPVGRVCFHLAENPADPGRPFAFMATFAAGFGAGGKLRHLPLRKALERYAGVGNRAALVNLLSPIQQASLQLGWVKDLADSGEIYRPSAWSADRAYRLLCSVAALEDAGLSVRLPNWWKKRARPQVSVTIGEQKRAVLGAGAMLDFDVAVALGGQTLSAAELAELLGGEDGLVLLKGQWVEVDREKLRDAIGHFDALQQRAKGGEISFIEGMRLLAGASADLQHEEQADEEKPWVHVAAGEAMREILASLHQPSRLDPLKLDNGLRADLRPYQRDGLAWLRLLSELGLGACLADDMGLGKTMQVLALLLQVSSEPRAPSLLVVPASLLANWRSEAARFAPSLKLAMLHPSETDKRRLAAIAAAPEDELVGTDLVVTTYSMLTRQQWLAPIRWRLVILDEAQAIKNAGTRQAKAVKRLSAHARIALTGTPVENRLGDLWSLFDFLNPGLLGSSKVFGAFVKSLQARPRDRFAPLRKLVGPYILRRLKTDRSVISDLPDKTETLRHCTLTKQQAALYEQIVRTMKEALESADGMARRGLVLQSLMRLKQVCNHPSQLRGDGEYDPAHSGKFARLAEICDEVAARQEKVLVFTQFREIIDPLADHLGRVFGRAGVVLHGGTSVARRKGLVEQFQDPDGPPFFILSLKAGGTGLNLTAASHVVHFDRWWNPAVESQATDRAFRIGQKRNVLVHKFITRGTVEERIDAMIEEKRQLTQEILAGDGEMKLTEMSDEALLELVRLDWSQAIL